MDQQNNQAALWFRCALFECLKLHKLTQVSFAEYHSKRNYVERVHAEENRVLVHLEVIYC